MDINYDKMDDKKYIKRELKPFHIIAQDINNEECTYYSVQIRPLGAENCNTCTELITTVSFKNSLTGKSLSH